MFIADCAYFVILDGCCYGIVSGTTAAQMVANGSKATFAPCP